VGLVECLCGRTLTGDMSARSWLRARYQLADARMVKECPTKEVHTYHIVACTWQVKLGAPRLNVCVAVAKSSADMAVTCRQVYPDRSVTPRYVKCCLFCKSLCGGTCMRAHAPAVAARSSGTSQLLAL
jgi:hypothetical protein